MAAKITKLNTTLSKPPTVPEEPDAEVAVFDPAADVVPLGDTEYHIKPVPIARFKRFKTLWLEMFNTLNAFMVGTDYTNEDVMNALLGFIEDKPEELLRIIVPSLKADSFEDEENGLTVPQLMDAFEVALRVNRLEFLKRAIPFVMAEMRMQNLRKEIASMETKKETTETELSAKTSLSD